MSMLLSIAYSNICGRKCGKPERISAHRQQHVREPVQHLDGSTHVTHCCSSTRYKYVESRCLHRWRISESRSVRHWSGNRRFSRREIKIKKWIGHQDNNVAEYADLLE